MKRTLLLVSLILLVGCIPARVQNPPAGVSLTAKGRALEVRSVDPLTVRAFVNVGKNRVWIEDAIGVPCTTQSAAYSASFTTPARIEVLHFGGAVRGPVVECRSQGEVLRKGVACVVGPKTGNGCRYLEVSLVFDHPRNRNQ